jgi:hypothetical protein
MLTEIYMSYFIEFFEKKKGLPLNKVSCMVPIVRSFRPFFIKLLLLSLDY